MSLDAAEIDLSDCFEKGMGYVALSRVRTLAGLSLKGFNDIALRVSGDVLNFDKELRKLSEHNRGHIEKLGEKIAEMHEEFKNKISGEEKSLTSPKRLRGVKKQKGESLEETKRLFSSGLSVKEVSDERGLAESTVFAHIIKIKEEDPSFNVYALRDAIPKSRFQKIYQAFQKVGTVEGGKRPLTPVRELLGDSFSFDELRIVKMFL